MQITFKPVDPSLAESLYEYRQDPVTKKYNPLMSIGLEDLRRRLSKASSNLKDYATAEEFFWYVEFEGRIAGNVSIKEVNRTMLTAEIGYGVYAWARRRGVATYAVKTISEKVFALTPLRKLIAIVHEQNLASRKVLEKVGYVQEGLLRQHYLVNGQPANEIIFGLLRGEIL